jgi:hypothetical protein
MGSALGKRLQSGGRSEPSSETFAALCSANLGGKGSGDLEAQGSVKKTAGKLKTGQFGFAARATLAPLKKGKKRVRWPAISAGWPPPRRGRRRR